MSASGCSSSQWRTPTDDSKRGGAQDAEKRLEGGHTLNLQDQVQSWPTPDAAVSNDGEEPETFLARQEAQKARGINGNGMGTPLAMAVKLWPTPNATDGEKAPNHFSRGPDNPSLPTAVKMWPTPKSSDPKSGADRTRRDTGLPQSALPTAVELWSTPRASDCEKGSPNQSFGAGGIPLPAQAAQWVTPTVSGNSNRKGSSATSEDGLRTQAVLRFSLPDRPISTVGEEHSHIRRTLNPLFVEWLMGWPRGWTCLALTHLASIGFACSETELYRFRQRMRGALSQLALHDDTPAQASLFA